MSKELIEAIEEYLRNENNAGDTRSRQAIQEALDGIEMGMRLIEKHHKALVDLLEATDPARPQE